MPLSWDEACARVAGPGSPFEIIETEVLGRTSRVFRHAPPHLRAVFQVAKAHGEATFLVYGDERWSFAEVMNRVDALGHALVHRYGVAKGDRVAIAMRNYPEWVMSFAAALSVGAISVSLNALWTADELDYAIGDASPKVVIADVERIERLAPTCRRAGVAIVAVRGAAEGADRWDDVVVPGAALPEVDILPDDDATILYTSGTTGRPKGAVSTHRAVISGVMGFGARNAVEVARAATPPAGPVPADSADSAGSPGSVPAPSKPAFILVVPLFHVTGCVPVMMSAFVGGLKLVMMYKWNVTEALQLIERERVTNLVGVPTQTWDLVNSPEFANYDTTSLKSMGGGGAPAPPALVPKVSAALKGAGVPNLGYGMTETNAYGPGHSGADYISHPTSTGRAFPITVIEIRDDDHRPVARGERGEVWFNGPNLIRGYWGKPEATAETIVHGWLRSGDIGRMDDEGFLYLEDRAKDMILRGGENVYGAEVEAAIYEHSAVHEAAVYGVPDERLGEEVGVSVVLRTGETLSADELRAFIATRIAGFKVPRYVVFSTEPLPRNAAGKFLKRELRDAFVASRAA